jgi:hypothetical protein
VGILAGFLPGVLRWFSGLVLASIGAEPAEWLVPPDLITPHRLGASWLCLSGHILIFILKNGKWF